MTFAVVGRKLIRRKQVLEKCAFGTTTLYKLMGLGLFPKPVPLTPSGQAVGWIEDEVDYYNAQLIAAARNPASPK
jgi:predicted DNA-binding transcriptional regulator AlpA